MRYQYVAAFGVLGVTTTDDVLLYDEGTLPRTRAFLTKQPDPYLVHFDTAHALAAFPLLTTFKGLKARSVDDYLSERIEHQRDVRRKRLGSSPLLCVTFDGHATIDESKPHEVGTEFALGFDLINKGEIRREHETALAGICAASVFALGIDIQLHRIGEALYCYGDDGKLWVSLSADVTAEAIVSEGLLHDRVRATRAAIQQVLADPDVVSVYRVVALASTFGEDELRRFVSSPSPDTT